MKPAVLIIILFFYNVQLLSQKKQTGRTRFVLGLSGPELFHAGITHRIADMSQLGLSLGAGPSVGMVWTSISLEHRLYLGKKSEETNQKTWFFRQGSTYFPAAKSPQQFTLNLTIGKDVVFKNPANGITIDAGVFYLEGSGSSSVMLVRSLNLWPSLRFQFYFGL